MITFCTSEEFTLQIEGVGRTEYNIILTQEIGKDLPVDDIVTELSDNPVKSSGIWDALHNLLQDFLEALGLHINATADAHKSSAISHRNSNVADRIDGITEGDVTRDIDGNLTSIITFGEATGFIRDIEGNVIGWEDATHIRMIKYTAAGDFDGWTLTEKP